MTSDLQSCFHAAQIESAQGNYPDAIHHLTEVCHRGNSDSCYLLGRQYRDLSETALASWSFSESCLLGSVPGCLESARIQYLHGDSPVAREIAESGCSLGNNDLCHIGEWLQAPQELREARTSLDARCHWGEPEACLHFAQLELVTEADRSRGVAGFQNACHMGSADACYFIAAEAWYRLDFNQFREEAQKACQLGAAYACTSVGDDFFDRSRLADAASYDRLACNAGEDIGCTRLGSLIQHQSLPVRASYASYLEHSCSEDHLSPCFWATYLKLPNPEDPSGDEEAQVTQFCREGIADACQVLGQLAQSKGLSIQAAAYHVQACQQGIGNSCFAVGEHQEKKGNFKIADDWWARGCDLQSQQACAYLSKRADDPRS